MWIVHAMTALDQSIVDHPYLACLLYSAVASLATVIRYHFLVRDQQRRFRKQDPAAPLVAFDVNAVVGMVLYGVSWPCTLSLAIIAWILNRLENIAHKEVLRLPRNDGDRR